MSEKSGVVRADADGKALLETACRTFEESLFWTGNEKCLRLQYAFFAFCKTMWTKPMRWFAVGGGLLERVQKSPVGNRDKPIAIKVRIALLQFRQCLFGFEKFCIKRVLLLDKRITALKCIEVRRSMLHDLVLKFKDGVVELDTLFRVRDCFDEVADSFAGRYRAIERGYDVVGCHGKDYIKNESEVRE